MVSLKVTGTCKKGLLLLLLLLLFYLVRTGQNKTERNRTTTVDEDGMDDG